MEMEGEIMVSKGQMAKARTTRHIMAHVRKCEQVIHLCHNSVVDVLFNGQNVVPAYGTAHTQCEGMCSLWGSSPIPRARL